MTKILLVEDDKAIVANLTEFLKNEGYTVKSQSSGDLHGHWRRVGAGPE